MIFQNSQVAIPLMQKVSERATVLYDFAEESPMPPDLQHHSINSKTTV